MTTLKNLVDETTNIKNDIVECRNILKQILIDKKIEGLENETKLPTLINKVNSLEDFFPNVLYLYKAGDEITNITGGWIEGYKYSGTNCIFEKNADNITLSSTNINGKICCTTYNFINFSNYSKLCIEIVPLQLGTGCVRFGVTTKQKSTCEGSSGDIVVSATWNSALKLNEKTTLSVDLLTANTSAYAIIGVQSNSNTMKFKILNIWLEK